MIMITSIGVSTNISVVKKSPVGIVRQAAEKMEKAGISIKAQEAIEQEFEEKREKKKIYKTVS